jgi:peptide deformylase
VEVFDARIHRILDDMRDTLKHANGVGLAAVQIGVLYRICLIMTPSGVLECINPEISAQSKVKIGEEMCLSLPGECYKVKRPQFVTVTAFDRHGHQFMAELKGISAVCACHEIDHLNGILFVDRTDNNHYECDTISQFPLKVRK